MLLESFENVLDNSEADFCVLSNPEKNIYELLKSNCDDHQNLNGIAKRINNGKILSADISTSAYLPSPYITKLLTAENAQKYGIFALSFLYDRLW